MVKTTSNTRYRKASVNTFPIFSVVIIPLITMEGRGLRGFFLLLFSLFLSLFFFFRFCFCLFVCFRFAEAFKVRSWWFFYIIICNLFLLECYKQHTPSLSTSSTKRCIKKKNRFSKLHINIEYSSVRLAYKHLQRILGLGSRSFSAESLRLNASINRVEQIDS